MITCAMVTQDSVTLTRTVVRVVPTWLLIVLVGLLALLPRVVGLNDFYTIDEGYHWPGRVENFANALVQGDWAATNQTGHPGVTTMWLGALGRALAAQIGIFDPGWAGGGADYLGMLRLPLAVVNALAVVIGFVLLRQRIAPQAALLAAIFWAASPFLVAHSRVLHLDALLTSWMSLCVLLLIPTMGAVRVSRMALLSAGVCAGLAFLTKAPSLVLLPVAGLLLLLPEVQPLGRSGWFGGMLRILPLVIGRYLVWILVALLTITALWPAMWVAPAQAVGSVIGEIINNGAQPHHSGNYFLGHPIGDPGPLFYAATVLWRTTPWTLLGLLVLLAVLGRDLRARTHSEWVPGGVLAALLLFVLVFVLALTLQAKKFDRYLLPIWPALEILAAIGWMSAVQRILRRMPSLGRYVHQAGGLLWASVILALALNLAAIHPYVMYALMSFNPLLGGAPVAERVLLIGWGEGLERVGAWLRTRPDLGRGPVLSWIPPALAPFVPKEHVVYDLRPDRLREPSSYAVLYIRSVQRQESSEAEAAVRAVPPLYTVSIAGVELASVHQLPRPFAEPLGVQFGDGLVLNGITSELNSATLVITPSWSIQADQPGGVFCFVHVLAPDGQRVAQVDAPLDQGMFATWQAGQQFDGALPIVLPPDLPPGIYRVAFGVYRPEGGRLPLQGGERLPDALAGPDALLLTTFRR